MSSGCAHHNNMTTDSALRGKRRASRSTGIETLKRHVLEDSFTTTTAIEAETSLETKTGRCSMYDHACITPSRAAVSARMTSPPKKPPQQSSKKDVFCNETQQELCHAARKEEDVVVVVAAETTPWQRDHAVQEQGGSSRSQLRTTATRPTSLATEQHPSPPRPSTHSAAVTHSDRSSTSKRPAFGTPLPPSQSQTRPSSFSTIDTTTAPRPPEQQPSYRNDAAETTPMKPGDCQGGTRIDMQSLASSSLRSPTRWAFSEGEGNTTNETKHERDGVPSAQYNASKGSSTKRCALAGKLGPKVTTAGLHVKTSDHGDSSDDNSSIASHDSLQHSKAEQQQPASNAEYGSSSSTGLTNVYSACSNVSNKAFVLPRSNEATLQGVTPHPHPPSATASSVQRFVQFNALNATRFFSPDTPTFGTPFLATAFSPNAPANGGFVAPGPIPLYGAVPGGFRLSTPSEAGITFGETSEGGRPYAHDAASGSAQPSNVLLHQLPVLGYVPPCGPAGTAPPLLGLPFPPTGPPHPSYAPPPPPPQDDASSTFLITKLSSEFQSDVDGRRPESRVTRGGGGRIRRVKHTRRFASCVSQDAGESQRLETSFDSETRSLVAEVPVAPATKRRVPASRKKSAASSTESEIVATSTESHTTELSHVSSARKHRCQGKLETVEASRDDPEALLPETRINNASLTSHHDASPGELLTAATSSSEDIPHRVANDSVAQSMVHYVCRPRRSRADSLGSAGSLHPTPDESHFTETRGIPAVDCPETQEAQSIQPLQLPAMTRAASAETFWKGGILVTDSPLARHAVSASATPFDALHDAVADPRRNRDKDDVAAISAKTPWHDVNYRPRREAIASRLPRKCQETIPTIGVADEVADWSVHDDDSLFSTALQRMTETNLLGAWSLVPPSLRPTDAFC